MSVIYYDITVKYKHKYVAYFYPVYEKGKLIQNSDFLIFNNVKDIKQLAIRKNCKFDYKKIF